MVVSTTAVDAVFMLYRHGADALPSSKADEDG